MRLLSSDTPVVCRSDIMSPLNVPAITSYRGFSMQVARPEKNRESISTSASGSDRRDRFNRWTVLVPPVNVVSATRERFTITVSQPVSCRRVTDCPSRCCSAVSIRSSAAVGVLHVGQTGAAWRCRLWFDASTREFSRPHKERDALPWLPCWLE